MGKILIMEDEKGGTAILTTGSSIATRVTPVLRVHARGVYGDFGPGDIIGNDCRTTAAEVVAGWAKTGKHTKKELELVRLFLSQWPEGPQN